ncbi:hypothetical protein KJ359_000530 [Pestalotiopsis sp. 9143b]|nr:hypothetical protein KJ359_000530 [Pestalotiopsis sp. 9143b]
MQAIIDKFDETVDAIIRTTTLESATFETVVRPWANAENETQGSWQMIDSLRFYSPSIETQDAVHKALELLGQAQTRWAQRDDWFMLLCAALLREKDNTNLTQESRFYIERAYKDCMHFSHGLMSQRTREQYLEEEVKIMGLACAYTRNVTQESDGIWFEEKALDGVPADELARLEIDDSSPNERKRRSSQAHKLGFPNHAEFRAPKRALGSTWSIHTFLDGLENDLIPLVRREFSEMKYVRNCDRELRGLPQPGDEELFPVSDRAYCHAIMLKALQVDEDLLPEFFPLDHVMNAMLGLFTDFLGLRFDRVSGSDLDPAAKWHEDVEIFAVWDCPAEGEEEADFIGYLYLDLLFRNHKYRNGQTVNLEKGYRKSDGSRKYPSTILSCALSTPAPGTCKLLKQAELVQIFHELGHAMHDLLTKTEFVRFHGAGSLPVDATEIPSSIVLTSASVLMENLAWVEDVLAKLSRHYTTLDVKYLDQWRKNNPGKPDPPESIPDELVQALVRSRWLNQSESYYARL